MSQLVAPAITSVDHIPLGRRIREIMKEKGNYYTVSSMASRLGINRDTYRTMLNGQRDIYYFELEKIATDLKVSVERILQQDNKRDAQILDQLLNKQENPIRAVEIAKQAWNQSYGVTERCESAIRLGLAQYFNQEYDDAYETANKGHMLALQLKDMHEDSGPLYRALTVLMDVYTAKQDYINASKILEQVEPYFRDNPTRSASLNYLHSKIKESQGDYESAKLFSYDSMQYALAAQKQILLGRTQVNAAHFEYLTGNYLKSEELLRSAIGALEGDLRTQLVARKELVKSLIKLEELDRANEEISRAMGYLQGIDFPVMEGKLLLLQARAQNDPSLAESVLSQEKHGRIIRILACKFLMNYSRSKGDYTNFVIYYEKVAELERLNSDILDEGAL